VQSPDLTGFSWFIIGLAVLVAIGFRSRVNSTQPHSTQAEPTTSTGASQLDELKHQCLQLRRELEQQKRELTQDLQVSTFETLRSLLINYPTATQIAQSTPDLPAKNLTALFTPLHTLLHDWGIEPIGAPWQRVVFDPIYHQPDAGDIEAGESVYIRFVGYRQGDRILCPAKVSRTLPSILGA
jgi:molecular chaperone GrpE (heat shock protein)